MWFWIIFTILAVFLDCAGTYYLINHHYADQDDNKLINLVARKWGLRTSLIVNFVIRVGAAFWGWKVLGIESMGLIAVPALLAFIVNAGNFWLSKRG